MAGAFRVCVADFGLSVGVGAGQPPPRPERPELSGTADPVAGTFVGEQPNGPSIYGPLRSMAPELLGRAERPVWSAASDMWGLGVSLWAAPDRRRPYSGVSAAEVRWVVLERGRPPRLAPAGAPPAEGSAPAAGTAAVDLPAAAHREVNALLDGCFAFDRQSRPRAEEAVEQLDRALVLVAR